MLILLEISDIISPEDVQRIISLYLNNPYPITLSKQKKPKCKTRLRINISDEDYYAIKEFNPKNRVDDVILALINTKHNELYYGSSLFADKNIWKREVVVKNVGRIDGLNKKDKIIVELKFFDGWKGALGQILSYHVFYPCFKKEVWLLMKSPQTNTKKDVITSICSKYDL